MPAWSPDGREVAFSQRLEDKWLLMVAAADGSGVRRIVTPGEARGPQWSPDGRWIYYYGRAGDAFSISRVPAGGGRSEEVLAQRTSVPQFHPDDGAMFCFQGQPRPGLWRHAGDRSQWVSPVFRDLNTFVVRRSGVYLEALGKPPESILYQHRFDTGRLERRLSIPQGIEGGFSVSPDERYLVFASYEIRGSDLWVIENLR